MRTSILIVLLSVVSLVLFAQAKPHISFTSTTYDYGDVAVKSNGDCRFSFKNTGTTPLVLNEVITSCGCTAVDWPKKPILSGDTASIVVKYDTRRAGNFNKSVIVKSNADNTPVTLTIKGNVLPKK